VALADWGSGMALGTLGGSKYLGLEVSATGNTEVVGAKMRTIDTLQPDDAIDGILITLGKQCHVIRLLERPDTGPGPGSCTGAPSHSSVQSAWGTYRSIEASRRRAGRAVAGMALKPRGGCLRLG
jgi:hypothetical protein